MTLYENSLKLLEIWQARANGLWHGPDPEELSQLSYAEAKVINLARAYVGVERFFLDRRSYARTAES